MSSEFTSKSFMQDPETIFAPLRAKSNVARIKLPIVGRVWLTTTSDATVAMLKDNSRFTMRKGRKSGADEVAGFQWWMPETIRLLANNMLTNDDPDHKRLRKLVDQAFQKQALVGLQPRLETIATDLARKMAHNLNKDADADLVSDFARPFPMAVICELLGLPEDIREKFGEQAARMTSISSAIGFLSALLPIRRMRKMLSAFVHDTQVRLNNGEAAEGLIGELVRVEADGDKLSHDELIAMVFLLLIAGHETTTHLISGSVLALKQNADQQEWLLADQGRMDMAVEELLRFVSPVQFTKPRYVRDAGPFFGVELQKGDLIMGGLASANFDPAAFENPKALDLQRRPNPHVEFGTGIHFCLGFQLARLELQVALRTLFSILPDLNVDEQNVQWGQRMGLRVLQRLPILKT